MTGETAGNADFTATVRGRAPIVFAFVLGLAFLLLLITFRSIVIPIKAILLNLLSVGAAYGVLVWIFQQGHLQGLLGFHANGGVVTWLPLFLFAVLFGLSMDYHVFILSRIRELVAGGMSTEEAGRARHPHDGEHGDERGDRDGRRVRHLRDALDARHQADGRRSGDRGPARRDDHPRGAAAGDDDAARRLELVPPARARAGCRSCSSSAPPQVRPDPTGHVVSAWRAGSRTLLYLVLALPLGAITLATMIAGWVLCALSAVTPLAPAALTGFRAVIGGLVRVDMALSESLLGSHGASRRRARPGRPATGGAARNVLADPVFWKQQVYLLQRLVLGFALAIVELALLDAGGGALARPIDYRWMDMSIGSWHVDSLGKALLFVPPGLLALALFALLVRPFGALARSLLVVLLDGSPAAQATPFAHTRAMRVRLLGIHAAVFVGVGIVTIVIWALTTRGYFWPIWPMLLVGVTLAMHVWVELVDLRPGRGATPAADPRTGDPGGSARSPSSSFVICIWALSTRATSGPSGRSWCCWSRSLIHAACRARARAPARRSGRADRRARERAVQGPSISRRASSAVSSGTCTMAPRRGSSRSA